MSVFNKFANVIQKGAVTGLFSVFAWQVWQIGAQCTEHEKLKRIEKRKLRNDHTVIMEIIANKVEEESQPHNVGTIPDRYDADDDSYLDKLPNLTEAISRKR